MDTNFLNHIESLHSSIERLLDNPPFTPEKLPQKLPKAGIYLFTENGSHLYVGRTNNLRRRIQEHCRPSSTHNSAPFAFLLARIAHGSTKASYRAAGSRKDLSNNDEFLAAFSAAKARLRLMDVRIVEENHPVTQALLEIYAAVTLKTPHNDFDNH